jgi:hypothetical protein
MNNFNNSNNTGSTYESLGIIFREKGTVAHTKGKITK